MGYSTQFVGVLKFAHEVTVPQLAALKDILGEDVRDHPEWPKAPERAYLNYIDLQLTDDFSGLEWNDAEKTYGLEEAVNVVTALMRQKWPEFRLTGHLNAQGESFEDRWSLVLDAEGHATKQPVVIPGRIVTCPQCEEKFAIEDQP